MIVDLFTALIIYKTIDSVNQHNNHLIILISGMIFSHDIIKHFFAVGG